MEKYMELFASQIGDLEGWDSEKETVLEQIHGGMTNTLFKATQGEKCVVFRLFGDGTEVYISRALEEKIVGALQAQHPGLAPQFLKTFENGRIEEWVTGRTLKMRDMSDPELAPLIARSLARLHSCSLEGFDPAPICFTFLRKLLALCVDIFVADSPLEEQKAFPVCGGPALPAAKFFATLEQDIADLEKETVAKYSSISLCHNDLQEGNILHCSRSGRVWVIDFEYGGTNFRGFDLGNHFCESYIGYNDDKESGGFFISHDAFPTEKQRLLFAQAYCDSCASPEEPRRLAEEAGFFMMHSHLTWALWGLSLSGQGAGDGGSDAFDAFKYGVVGLGRNLR